MLGLLAVIFASIAGESAPIFVMSYIGILILGTFFGAVNGFLIVYTSPDPVPTDALAIGVYTGLTQI